MYHTVKFTHLLLTALLWAKVCLSFQVVDFFWTYEFSYRLVLARAAVKNRDAILGMWLVTSCYQDLTGYYMAVLHHDDVISNSCLVCVDAGTVIVECECHYCLWQNHWALEGSGCSTLSEMPLFFQDGDMLVALGRKASSALLLFLQEHFAPLFVICRVEN